MHIRSKSSVRIFIQACLMLVTLTLLSVSVFSTNAQAASFDVNPTPLIFSDISDATDKDLPQNGKVRNISIKNNTAADLQITAMDLSEFPVTATNPRVFNFSTTPTLPFTIPPNGTVEIPIRFNAPRKGVHTGELTVSAGTQRERIDLRGLGTTGNGSSNEPSLQWILDTFALGIFVGDDDPSTTSINSMIGGTAPLLGDEISAQTFTRANTAQPVTMQVLASYANSHSASGTTSRNGWYIPGNANSRTEVFYVNANAGTNNNSQTLNPLITGSLSFVPGVEPFGIYSSYPSFGDRHVYSEDLLNNFDGARKHKFRVFPILGQPNTFVYATDEFNQAPFDYNDVVILVSNVVPVSTLTGPIEAEIDFQNRDWNTFRTLGLQNTGWMDKWMTFSTLRNQYTSGKRGMHRESTLRVYNRSSQTPLNVSSMTLSHPQTWQVKSGAAPFTIPPNGFRDVVLRVIEQQTTKAPLYGTLTINSSDPDEAVSTINLGLGHQPCSETQFVNGVEITCELVQQEMWDTFGFGTYIADIPGGKYQPAGEEIMQKFWKRKDSSKPIYAIQLGAFHGCGGRQQANFALVFATSPNPNMQHGDFFCQSYFPGAGEWYGSNLTQLTASRDDNFHFRIAGSESCVNTTECVTKTNGANSAHGVRVWPARDRSGALIPDVYLITQDYVDAAGSTNFDYNDNFYLVGNIMPVDPILANVSAWVLNPSTVAVGQNITLNFKAVTSLTPSDNVTFQVTLPNYVTYVSHSNPACQAPNGSGVIVCNFGNGFAIPQSIDVTVKPNSARDMTVVGQVFTSTTQEKVGDDTVQAKFKASAPTTPPTANNDSYQAVRNTPLVVSAAEGVLANDTGVASLSVTTQPASGTLALNQDGSFTYTPATNFTGQVSFVYAASNSVGSVNATVTITVQGSNLIPIANDDEYTMDEDSTLTVDAATGVLSNDEELDGEAMTVALGNTSNLNGNIILNSDGSFTYVPNANFIGNATFTYQVSDPNSNTATATVTITVNNVPDAPIANDDTYGTTLNTPITANAEQGVMANDVNVDQVGTLSVSILNNVTSGTLNLNADGSFTYTPNAGFIGADSFSYTLSDGTSSDTAIVNLTVNGQNLPPVAVDDAYNVVTGQTLVVAAAQGVLANDTNPDNNVLTATVATNVTSGVLTLNASGSFTYIPNANFVGTDSFTYTVNDGNGGTDTGAVTITVTPSQALQNLIVNGSFETPDPTKASMPASWKGKFISRDKIKCNKLNRPGGKPDKIFAAEGSCAFVFKGGAGENSRLQQKLDVASLTGLKAGDTLTLSALVEGKKVRKGLGKLQVKGRTTTDQRFKIVITLNKGTYLYTEVKQSTSVPGPVAALKAQIRYNGTAGGFAIDAVRLTVNDPNAGPVNRVEPVPQPETQLDALPLPLALPEAAQEVAPLPESGTNGRGN